MAFNSCKNTVISLAYCTQQNVHCEQSICLGHK